MPDYGELFILVSPHGKRRILCLGEGQDIHTGEGVLRAGDICAASFGSEIKSSTGTPFLIQRPSIYDLILGIKRQTQIIYPKDISYICMRLGVGPGRIIIEAGTGSGGLTLGLSWFCGQTGVVHSFEAREEFYKLARRNLNWAGLGQNVILYHHNIADGFLDVTDADALFLDVRTPWDYLIHIPGAVKSGATLAFLLPTVNQVDRLLLGLEQGDFSDVEVCELMLRHWKPIPDRLRPEERMNAHTGFLIFARSQKTSSDWDEAKPRGTRERKQYAAKISRLGIDTDLSKETNS